MAVTDTVLKIIEYNYRERVIICLIQCQALSLLVLCVISLFHCFALYRELILVMRGKFIILFGSIFSPSNTVPEN